MRRQYQGRNNGGSRVTVSERIFTALVKALWVAGGVCGLFVTACVLNPQTEDPSAGDLESGSEILGPGNAAAASDDDSVNQPPGAEQPADASKDAGSETPADGSTSDAAAVDAGSKADARVAVETDPTVPSDASAESPK